MVCKTAELSFNLGGSVCRGMGGSLCRGMSGSVYCGISGSVCAYYPINQQPGFISREFGKDTEGYWYFILKWTSKEAGDAWSPIFQKDTNGQALMNALDFSTVRQEHFTVVNP